MTMNRSVAALVITLTLMLWLFAGTSGQSSVAEDLAISDADGAINASLELIAEALPDLLPLIESHEAVIEYANPMQVAEALSGLETCIVSWDNIPGVQLTVVSVNGGDSWNPVLLEVILNSAESEVVGQLIKEKGMTLEETVKNAFARMRDEAVSHEGVQVIGFQIHINGIPVAFLNPKAPVVIPAMISWNSYYLGSVVSFRLVNDYPILESLLSNESMNYKISADDALALIESKVVYEVTPQVSKYLLINNGSVRPAYVSYVTPWKVAVVMADNGELLLPEQDETVSQVPTSSHPTSQEVQEGGWIRNEYLGVVMAIAIIAVVTLVARSRLKRI